MKNYKKYLSIHKYVTVPYVLSEFTENYPATTLSEFTYESASICGYFWILRTEMRRNPLSKIAIIHKPPYPFKAAAGRRIR